MDLFSDPLFLFWRSFGDWGLIIVIVAVALEVAAAAIGAKLDRLESKKWVKWVPRLKRYEVIAGWILVIGLAIEYKGHREETSFLDAANIGLTSEANEAVTNSAASYLAAAIAKREASQANERAANTESNNLVLSLEVEKLRHPSIIAADQRQRFIDVLSDKFNCSKTRIEVVVGNLDRPTEQFAFQIRELLDETGYGSETSKYQLSIIQVQSNAIAYTLQPPHVELPPFEWSKAIVRKIPNLTISPLPLTGNPSVFEITNTDGLMFASENPFTDKEPNIVAIFSDEIPFPNFRPTNAPSVFVTYPGENIPIRNPIYNYTPTKDPNAILYGLCEVFHDAGITVGIFTNNNIIAPGSVAFFIPQR